MRRVLIAAAIAAVMVMSAAPAVANTPANACNVFDRAHARTHATGTQGELRIHDLRGANHCGH